MDNHKRNTLIVTLWCIGNVLAIILTLLFMYVVYACQVKNNPNVAITTGYWVGFIFGVIPVASLFYGYCFKLKNDKDKRYLAIYITGIISLIMIFILILLGLSITTPAA